MQPGATRLGGRFTPTVDPDLCTGCGRCEKACVATEAAITVARSGRA
jgi:ferredoxin-type protein NapG